MATETAVLPSSGPVNATQEAVSRRPRLDLFLISFLILFLELACIRWFGSMVIYLSFFTNLVLMAAFLGMSVGCMAARTRRALVESVLPLMLLAVTLSCVALGGYVYLARGLGRLQINVGSASSPQEVFFGTNQSWANSQSVFVVPIDVFAVVFFLLNALMFVGLGQVMGRAFDSLPNRVAAYTINILGSLTGIVVFGMMSQFRTPPILWFGIGIGVLAWFVTRTRLQVICAVAVLTVIGTMAYLEGTQRITYWSPYYKIYYNPLKGSLNTNNMGHQAMVPVGKVGGAYMLPHLLNRDAGGPPFEDVMIIGAGSGNDVAGALAADAGHIDAVEIEPVLNEIGRRDHPNQPYSDPRVTIHLDDGRSFVRNTDKKYDLIIYALVDSLVLHSGYSSLRLESFLFTKQAFEEIKARLKPDGIFVMYNWYRQSWIVGRLDKMAEEVFGAPPVVLPLPYAETVRPDTPAGYALIIAGTPASKALGRIKAKFQEKAFFWLSERPYDNEPINGYTADPSEVASGSAVARDRDRGERLLDPEKVSPLQSSKSWERIGAARVESAGIGPLPTDDWPFLYLRETAIPSLTLRGMALVALVSLMILFLFAPVRTFRPNGQMFFLGAGFMLLETKSVVHMALLFGSTWVVNSIVFSAILVMILLSNLFVLAVRPLRLTPFYVLLIVALLVNAYVPMSYFLNLPGIMRVLASCAVVFIPIFFAGVIFAASFRDSQHPDVDFGSNVGGAILGGLCENASLIVGFNHLLLVAIVFYGLSAVLRRRQATGTGIAGLSG